MAHSTWGNKVDAFLGLGGSSQPIENTEVFSDDITVGAQETIHVQIDTESDGTTDSLIINFYTTLDDDVASPSPSPSVSYTGQQWDTVAITGAVLDATSGDLEVMSFLIDGPYIFRVGVQADAANDTLMTGIFYRKNGVGES